MKFWEQKFTFVDIETASLRPEAEILQIAGLITAPPDFKIIEEFNYYCPLTKPELADPESLATIDYTPERWAKAVPLLQALADLHPRVRGTTCAGYNSHFDWSRLERAFVEHGLSDPFDYRRFDLLSVLMLKFRNDEMPERETLSAFCDKLGVDRGQKHDALDDAKATFRLFLKIINQ